MKTMILSVNNLKEVINSLSLVFCNHREITCKTKNGGIFYGKINDMFFDFCTITGCKNRLHYEDIVSIEMY